MAESNSQIDILNHLLEVEKDVSLLVEQAVADAQKKVADAKVSANAMFQEKNAQTQSQLESQYESKLLALKNNREKSIQVFNDNLNSKVQNAAALNKCLDNLLFKE